jgi:hypothetical protein
LRSPRATVLETLAILSVRDRLRAAAGLTRHPPNRVMHRFALAGQRGVVISASLIRSGWSAFP